MAAKFQKTDAYIPDQQDIIWLDFDPAVGHEIRDRRPAVVLSNKGYSQLTNLVVVAPITRAKKNKLRKNGFFVPVNTEDIEGYVNPLQFFTYDYEKRRAEYAGFLQTADYVTVKQTVLDILD